MEKPIILTDKLAEKKANKMLENIDKKEKGEEDEDREGTSKQ